MGILVYSLLWDSMEIVAYSLLWVTLRTLNYGNYGISYLLWVIPLQDLYRLNCRASSKGLPN